MSDLFSLNSNPNPPIWQQWHWTQHYRTHILSESRLSESLRSVTNTLAGETKCVFKTGAFEKAIVGVNMEEDLCGHI